MDAAFSVMKQLRTHLDLQAFRTRLNHMQHESYELWALYHDQKVLGLVSTRLYTDLVRGTHLYIDDLVTDANTRSQGIGAVLLKHAEELAQKHGCEILRLCCVIENEAGMRFYRREGWKERAFALVKKIIP
jgi:GNAT superfamily N-acetyltransferase